MGIPADTCARPSLAVIVPATDRPATLERCLAALRWSTAPPDELIVVDRPAGAGPAQARNAGVARAKSEVVAFVDADVEVLPDSLARLRALFAADPGLVGAFGSYDDAPAAPGAVSQFRNLLHHHVHSTSPGPAETFWAGLGAVRRDAFLAAGGFAADRFAEPSIADIELGVRLRAAGGRIELDPGVRCKHLKRWSLAEMVRSDLVRRGVPWVRLELERRGTTTALNLAWRHRLSALAALAAVIATAARRPVAAAAAAGALIGLNASFYGLLRRRGGLGLAAVGLPLHALHLLVAAVSVPVGLAQHLRAGRPARMQR